MPQIKKNVLNACVETVAADGLIQLPEAELLRAIADSLDCPIPPFIPLGLCLAAKSSCDYSGGFALVCKPVYTFGPQNPKRKDPGETLR